MLHLGGFRAGRRRRRAWQGSTLADGDSPLDRVGGLWDRVRLFYEAATGGGISTDLLPVSLVVLSAAWIMGYFSSWYLFRRTNVWVGLVVWGMAMLTALSFLPSRYVVGFFAFTFLSMMLVARVTMLQRRDRWSESGFETFSPSRWLVVRGTVVFAAVVLLAAAVLPLKLYHSRVAVDLWRLGRTPVAFLQDDMTRLLSALPSREERMGRFFGDSLPFIGKIGFDNEVAFWADSEARNYWLSRTYSRYTSQGWFTGDTEERAGRAGRSAAGAGRAQARARLAVPPVLFRDEQAAFRRRPELGQQARDRRGALADAVPDSGSGAEQRRGFP